ncbi:hypothetical protein SDC9_75047 [bioreactor metagenome]|uniref:Uncharacterized protein n=1 Tax=bioreactor metagenome TaxID=1076179 RepID=A0A644YKW3_9ZZZZ
MKLHSLTDLKYVGKLIFADCIALRHPWFIFACRFVLTVKGFIDLINDHPVLYIHSSMGVDGRQRSQSTQSEHSVCGRRRGKKGKNCKDCKKYR